MLGTQKQKLTQEGTQISKSYLASAKTAIQRLQSDCWRDQPLIGWRWKDIEAWQSCVIADSLITYTLLSRNHDYVDVIEKALNYKTGLGSNDDDLWSAIAALKFYYLTGDYSFYAGFVPYEYSQIVEKYWDERCGGGVWWKYYPKYGCSENSKNAITNELWILFLTLIYCAKGEPEYLERAKNAWKWFDEKKLINNEHLINDGLTRLDQCPPCVNSRESTWTYNQGVILGALANLSRWLENSLISKAKEIACAVKNSKSLVTTEGILKEPDKEPPNDLNQDQQSFKGIFMRNCAYLVAALAGNESAELVEFITRNADYVQEHAVDQQGQVNAYWDGSKELYGAAAQGSGIDLFTSAARVTSHPNGKPWSYTLPIVGVGTSESPCTCEYNGRLYALWKGVNDKHIWFASMDQNNQWTGQNRISGEYAETDKSPAVAVFNGRLYALWRYPGSWHGYLYFASMDQDNRWTGGAREDYIQGENGYTSDSPAVAFFNGRLYALWKGDGRDGGIYFASMDQNNKWNSATKIEGLGTSKSPAAAVFNGRLYALWKGYSRDDGIYFASMDQNNQWNSQTKIEGVGTSESPATAVFNSVLHAAWKGVGSDSQIWYASMAANSGWSPQTLFVVPGRTLRSPALATFNGRLYNLRSGNPGNSVDPNNIFYSYFPYEGLVGF